MSGPRLPDLTPDAVASEACDLLAVWLREMWSSLWPQDDLAVGACRYVTLLQVLFPSAMAQTVLAAQARALTVYAQTGELAGLDAHDGFGVVTNALLGRLYYPPAVAWRDRRGERDVPHDPTTAVGAVLRAAHARHRIDRGEPVTTRDLAALGGVSTGRVQQLLAAGYRGGAVRARGAVRSRGRASEVTASAARRVLAVLATDGTPPVDPTSAVYRCGKGLRWLAET